MLPHLYPCSQPETLKQTQVDGMPTRKLGQHKLSERLSLDLSCTAISLTRDDPVSAYMSEHCSLRARSSAGKACLCGTHVGFLARGIAEYIINTGVGYWRSAPALPPPPPPAAAAAAFTTSSQEHLPDKLELSSIEVCPRRTPG